MKTGIAAFVAFAGLAAAANGQYSLSFSFPNGNVYDGNANVEVELYAHFASTDYSFAGWGGSVNGDPTGEFSNMALVLKNSATNEFWPGQNSGTSAGGNVTGITAGQLQFSGLFNSATGNPLLIWKGEWSTSDLSERTVDLSTSSIRYETFVNSAGVSVSHLLELDNASGQIEVVPAPASLALLGLGGLVAGRRRR